MKYTTNKLEAIDHTIKGDFPVDFDLLFDIMYQQSPTYQPELEAIKKDWLIELISKIEGVTVYEKGGNIYCTKGAAEFYPTIVAHYDTAQDYHVGMRIFKTDEWIFGFDNARGEQCGLGLDDSVGVCFAIQMLKVLPNCKVALFYAEERGCIGSGNCDMSFFDNSLVVAQLDRRSYTNDFIKFTNGVQTFNPDHYDLLDPLMDKYGYSLNSGTATDVGKLRQRGLKVSSFNQSCGYFNEHGDSEVASVALMINAFSFTYDLLVKIAERNIPLTFPVPNLRSELPYGGSKTKSSSTYLGTGAKQINIWDDDDADWYYDVQKGEWMPPKSELASAKSSKHWSRPEDPLDMLDPFGDVAYDKDKAEEAAAEEEYEIYSEWMTECYPQYQDPRLREGLESFSNKSKVLYKQADLDEMMMEGICPNCLGDKLHVTNDLLLNSYCYECESIFNVPEDEQDFIETMMKDCKAGEVPFEEIVKL
jgi:hypothetical protein